MGYFLKLFLIISVCNHFHLSGQDCDPGFVYVEDVPSCCGAPAQHCFWEEDFNVLQQLIDNSSHTINMEMDDNEDGIIQPVELGQTEWVAGRLIELDCFLSGIMSCHLTGPLPENFGNLTELEFLWLNSNHLMGEIPESIGNLTKLETLYLSQNQFTGALPQSLCNLGIDWGGENPWGVEYFTIEGIYLANKTDNPMIAEYICDVTRPYPKDLPHFPDIEHANYGYYGVIELGPKSKIDSQDFKASLQPLVKDENTDLETTTRCHSWSILLRD